MNEAWNADPPPRIDSPDRGEHLSTIEARQGVSGMGVRYVLAVSLSAALALMAVLYFVYGTP